MLVTIKGVRGNCSRLGNATTVSISISGAQWCEADMPCISLSNCTHSFFIRTIIFKIRLHCSQYFFFQTHK